MSQRSILLALFLLAAPFLFLGWGIIPRELSQSATQDTASSLSTTLELRQKLEALQADLMHRAELAQNLVSELSEAEIAALQEEEDEIPFIAVDKLADAQEKKEARAVEDFMIDNAPLIAEAESLIDDLVNLHDPIGLRMKGSQLAGLGNFSDGLPLLMQAAELKDPISMRLLSFYYISLGPDIIRDKVEAAKWDILAEYYWMNELGRLDHSDKKYPNQSYLFTEEERQAGISRAKAWLREHKETT